MSMMNLPHDPTAVTSSELRALSETGDESGQLELTVKAAEQKGIPTEREP